MIVLLLVFSLLVSLFVLYLSGDRVVEYGRKIASSLGVSSFLFGLVAVSLGTSLPEIVVGIISALAGYPEIVVGDVLGSNIADLFLLVGVYALITRWKLSEDQIIHLVSIVAFAGVAFTYTLIRGEIGLLDGLFLILLFFLFVRERSNIPSPEDIIGNGSTAHDGFVFLLSLTALAISSYTAVQSIVALSHLLNISPFVVSAITLAFGTSLPELSVGINAIRRGEQYMALGDAIGSIVVNTTLGLGLPSFLVKIPVFLPEERFTIFLLLLGLFVFIHDLSRRRALDRRTSLIFFLLYVAFLVGILLMLTFLFPYLRRVEKPVGHLFLIKQSLPFLFLGVVASLLAYTDVYMLYFFRSYHDIGIYRAAYSIILGLFGLTPFTLTLLPYFARRGERESLYLVISKVTLSGVALFSLAIVFGPPLILLLYAGRFLSSVPILYILSPLLVISSATTTLGSFLLSREGATGILSHYFLGLLLNLFLDLLLVPPFGTQGAAIATVSASLSIFASMLYGFLRKKSLDRDAR